MNWHNIVDSSGGWIEALWFLGCCFIVGIVSFPVWILFCRWKQREHHSERFFGRVVVDHSSELAAQFAVITLAITFILSIVFIAGASILLTLVSGLETTSAAQSQTVDTAAFYSALLIASVIAGVFTARDYDPTKFEKRLKLEQTERSAKA